MAFEIRDLMIDVLPSRAGRTVLWATCAETTDIKSECHDPSCGGQCEPRSNCAPVSRPTPPQPPQPEPGGRVAAPAGLLLLRRQLHASLAQRS